MASSCSRLIIKFSNPAKKQIVTCYWLPKKCTPPTIEENSSQVVKESVVVATHNNIVADDPNGSSPKPPTTQKLRKVCVDAVSLAARNGKRRPLLVIKKENRVDHQGLCESSTKNGFTETELIKKENEKKPIEHYKKMQCWVILKRMIEGKDGWALKNPLDQKYLKGLDQNNKAIGLKDIEAKLKSSYSTTDEFAKDMRFVFSHGLLYHPKNVVHRIAMKFSEIFENKWKSLNEEWNVEEKRVLKHKIHKRKRESVVLSPKCDDTLSMILKEQTKMYGSFNEYWSR